MSISIEDLKSQLSAAVDTVPAGMPEPLEALYSRDKEPRHSTLLVRPARGGNQSPALRKRWIAVFVVGLAVCLVALLVVTIGRTTGQSTKALGGSNAEEVIVQVRSELPANHAQLEDAAAVIAVRLRFGGITGATVVVSGDYIVITAKGQNSKFNEIANGDIAKGLLAPGNLLLRPVLCAVPAYRASAGSPLKALPSTCPRANLLTAANLDVNVNTQTPLNSPSPWAALAGTPSTPATVDFAPAHVLLPVDAGSDFRGERLLLGPAISAQLHIAQAKVRFDAPSWLVDLTLSPQGSIALDTLAVRQFHAYIAEDLDGSVLSAPLTMPAQASFSSFGGKLELSAGFTKATATNLVMDLRYPVPLPLKVVSDEESVPFTTKAHATKRSTSTPSSASWVPIALFQSRNGNGTTPTFRVPMQSWQIRYDFSCSRGAETYRITLLPEGRSVTSPRPADGGEADFLESGAGSYRLQVETPSTCSWSVSIYPWG